MFEGLATIMNKIKLTPVMYMHIQKLLKVLKVFTKLNILVIKMNISNDESKINQIYRNGLCT
jgi:hypothetical protein